MFHFMAIGLDGDAYADPQNRPAGRSGNGLQKRCKSFFDI